MNAYFFQMNNLKGLAADESGSSVFVERLARSDRFTARSSVGWTSSAWRGKTEEVVQSTTQGWSWLNSHKSWRRDFYVKIQHPTSLKMEPHEDNSLIWESQRLKFTLFFLN